MRSIVRIYIYIYVHVLQKTYEQFITNMKYFLFEFIDFITLKTLENQNKTSIIHTDNNFAKYKCNFYTHYNHKLQTFLKQVSVRKRCFGFTNLNLSQVAHKKHKFRLNSEFISFN